MAPGREKVIQLAERYVSRGKIQAAIREYRKVLKKNPRDANTLNRVGDLYARIERIDDAVGLFMRIAEQYADEGFLLKAIAIYKKIIKLAPTRLPVYEQLAELYHRQGLVNEARSQYQVLADYYDKHNDEEAALAIFQHMVDLEPENPSHRAKLADLSQRLGRVDDAIGQYKAVAEQMLSEGHFEKASRVYERALDIESENIGFITDAVLKLKEAGQTEAAQRLLTMAVERNPRAEQVARLLGQGEPEAEIFLEVEEGFIPPAGTVDPSQQSTVEMDPQEFASAASEAAPLDLIAPAAATVPLDSTVQPPSAATPDPTVAPASAVELPEVDLDFDLDDEVFSFDLEDDSQPASQVLPPPDMVAPAEAEPTAAVDEDAEEFELDLGEVLPADSAPVSEVDVAELAEAAAEVSAKAEPRIDDLVAESEVLAKYGLFKKAQERLKQVLAQDPNHLGGLSVLLAVELEIGRKETILEVANQLAEIAAQSGETTFWEGSLQQLERAGYVFEDGQVLPSLDGAVRRPPRKESKAAPKVPKAKQRTPAQELDQIVADLAVTPRIPPVRQAQPAQQEPSPQQPPSEVQPPVAAEPPPVAEAAPVEPVAAEPPPVAPPPAAEEEKVVEPPAAAPPASPAVTGAQLDESMSWLDATAPQAGAAGEEEIFTEEQEFFDLAAELEQELSAEGSLGSDNLLAQPQEQTLEEIVEGFKRGVAENLSAEDYETHFNLGIAYCEMGLLDEAIGEFQLAAKGDGRLVECASMLGLCFLDKGLPELAIKWYSRGLEAPAVTEEATLGLMYDLGNAYLSFGAREAAYETFVEIYGINTHYRDVVAKLEELAPGK